jgi:hypothetical protein
LIYISGNDPAHPTDVFAEKNDSDVDAPQDGRGDPNLSGITPPLPLSLVEPQLRAYDTGFYVITSGLEVGITTVKYVHFPSKPYAFSPFSRGIADSRLACQNPSSQIFSTWRQARSYYEVCFNDGSVIIRTALQDQTPTQSPARKKQRLIKYAERRLLPQPPFSPAFSASKAKGSASQPINVSSTESSPASNSIREYTPLYFPESPPVPSKSANSRKRLHAGFQAIPRNADKAASPSGQYPEPTIPGVIPGVRPLGQYPEQAQASLAPPPPDLGHIDPRYVFVESSSDEDAPTDSKDNSTPTVTRPRPRPRQVHSDAPTPPVIIISDSEEDSEEAPVRVGEELWPHPTDHDSINKMKELFGPPGFGFDW